MRRSAVFRGIVAAHRIVPMDVDTVVLPTKVPWVGAVHSDALSLVIGRGWLVVIIPPNNSKLPLLY